jgi:amino acid adenylation domain-containing protein
VTTVELLSHLRELGVSVWAEGERLRVNAPAGVLTAALREQMSERKAEILGFLARVARSAGPAPVAPPLTRVSRDSALPLSFAQQRLWFIDQLEPGSPAYNIPVAFRLRGLLHQGTLAAVLTEILRRHEVLRTTFPTVGGEPVQVIAPPILVHLPVIDLSSLPAEDRDREEARLIALEARRPFNLSRGPLFRGFLLRLAVDEGIFLNMHHAVSDGWSLEILFREIAALYNVFREGRPSPLPELPLQYADFASWQRGWLQGEVLEAELSYWRERLRGAAPVLKLPTDRPRPATQTFRGATRKFQSSDRLAGLLQPVARQSGATPFMLLLAAFNTMLYRYSDQEDISVGTPIAGRHRAEVEGLIGLFVNTLVIRTSLSGDPRFVDLLTQVRTSTLEAYQHQDLPFEKLVEELRPERSLSHPPLFQVMFALQNFKRMAEPGPGIRQLGIGTGMAKFDLSVMLAEGQGGRLAGGFDHNVDLFDGSTIQRMVEHFTALLEGIAACPESRISELPLLTSAERQQLLREWNDTGFPDRSTLLHTLFEEQSRRTPDAVAVVCGERRWTYRELDHRAGVLMEHLRARGVGPEEVVGLCIDRSEDMVAALLGILKAGAAYLPLDPGYPRERLFFMIEDAGLRILLTREGLGEALPPRPGVEALALEALREPPPSPRPVDLPRQWPENLAYLIYTSGSTGRPKGVAISHGSAVELIHWSRKVFGDGEIAATLASTSINFDLSVFELFVPLSRGGTVFLADNALTLIERRDLAATLLNTVPSAIAELLRADAVPASVETVNLAGEPLQAALVRQIYQRTAARRVYNLYGPSEDTTYSTFARIDRGFEGEPPIGRPLSSTWVYLLDGRDCLVPAGAPGELYLGGAGLARGYLNRPDLTAERFVPDPFSPEPGARIYRTGDLARYRSDGLIEFLGRLDSQVKIRGFRIEPTEIEAALTRHPGIGSAVVVPRGGPEGSQELAAFLVAAGESRPSAGELRQFLGELLPGYMIPSSLSFTGELPLAASGKIDRRAVASLAAGTSGGEAPYVPPEGEVEQTLVEIWQRVLGRERIGVEDNFFDLGGDSLKTIRVLTAMRERGLDASVRDFFRSQTIRTFARHCRRTSSAAENDRGLEPPVHRTGSGVNWPVRYLDYDIVDLYELGPSQEWFFTQPWRRPDAFVMPRGRRVEGHVDPEVFRTACRALLENHPILNTVFPDSGPARYQLIVRPPETSSTFEFHDLSGLSLAEQRDRAERRIQEVVDSLSLDRWPLFRFFLFQIAEDQYYVLFLCHHLLCDQFSVEILGDDLFRLYSGLVTGGRLPDLPPVRSTYGDFVRWQRRFREEGGMEESLKFWLREVPPDVPLPKMPIDFPDAPDSAALRDQRTIELDAEQTRRLERNARELFNTSLSSVLVAAAGRATARWSGNDDVVLLDIRHGRFVSDHLNLERTVGFIAVGAPVRIVDAIRSCLSEVVRETAAKVDLIAQEMGWKYGCLWREIPNHFNTVPTSDKIIVNYFGSRSGALGDTGFQPTFRSDEILPCLVELLTAVVDGKLRVTASYSRARFRSETVERLTVLLREELEAAVALAG